MQQMASSLLFMHQHLASQIFHSAYSCKENGKDMKVSRARDNIIHI